MSKIPTSTLGVYVSVRKAGFGRRAVDTGEGHVDENGTSYGRVKVDPDDLVPIAVGQVGVIVGRASYASGVSLMAGYSYDVIVKFGDRLLGFWVCGGHRAKKERYIEWCKSCPTLRVACAIDLLGDLAEEH